jgi:acyl-CoA synthetase (AMP-forming)/AMP-acid ligase II
MFDFDEVLLENGLIGSFNTCCLMMGENIAVAASRNDSDENEIDSKSIDSKSIDSSISKDLDGISYLELSYSVNSLSSQLYNRFGVRKGMPVLILCKNNTAAEIVACLACIKLEAPFVAVDDTWLHAGERLKSIVEDAQPIAAIVCAKNHFDKAVLALNTYNIYRCTLVDNSGNLIDFDASATINELDCINNCCQNEDNDLVLYITYTSGSTGNPKGVMGTHKGLINRIRWQIKTFPWQNNDIACRRTPLTFIDSLAEIFSALLCCVPIWTPSLEKIACSGIASIVGDAGKVGATRITLLPSQLYCTLNQSPDIEKEWKTLRIVFVSGEACHWNLVRKFKTSLPNTKLVNLYGSTEVSGDVSFVELTSVAESTNSLTPIGKEISGNFLFVVKFCDKFNDDRVANNVINGSDKNKITCVADGEEGELLVVGEHVAIGYNNCSTGSSENFIANPFSSYSSECTPNQNEYEKIKLASHYKRAYLTGMEFFF